MKLSSKTFFGGAAALSFGAAALTGVSMILGAVFAPAQTPVPQIAPPPTGITQPSQTPVAPELPQDCRSMEARRDGALVPIYGARTASTEQVEPTSDVDGFTGARGMGFEVLASEYFEETGCSDDGKKWLFIRMGTVPVEAQFKTDFSYRYSTVLDAELSDITVSIDGRPVSSVDVDWVYDESWGYAIAEVPADADDFDFAIDMVFTAELSDDPEVAKKHDERFSEVPLDAELTYSSEFSLSAFKAQSRVCDGGEPGC